MKAFKLEDTINTSNMHLYDANGKIKRYQSPTEIILEYFPLRLEYYRRRKENQLSNLQTDLTRASAKLRFVLEVIEEKLQIHKKKRAEIEAQLIEHKFPRLPPKKASNRNIVEAEATEETDASVSETDAKDAEAGDYNYLLHMRIESFSHETLEKLTKEQDRLDQEVKWLESKSPSALWSLDLDNFQEEYKEFVTEWEEMHATPTDATISVTKTVKIPVPKRRRVVKIV